MESSVAGFAVATLPTTIDGARTIHAIEDESRTKDNPSLIGPLLWPRQKPFEGTLETKPISSNEDKKGPTFGGHDNLRELKQMKDPANSYLVATEEVTGKPVAYAFWQYHHGKSEEEWTEFYRRRHRPPGMNHALADATGGVRILKRAKILGDEDCMSKSRSFNLLPCVRPATPFLLLH